MKQNFARALAICAACLLASTFLLAQEIKKVSPASSPYLISAKAGAVNFISGKVAVVRKKGKGGYLLKGDVLEIGDKVLTGSSGRAEILLNPGSFVRLGGNSEFEFITTNLDDLQVKVTSGSAILEVITASDFTVAVNTPKSRFYIVKSGVYRVDTINDGRAKIEVWKGKAEVAGNSRPVVIKAGQTTVVDNGQAAVEKFDRDNKDDFVAWSKERARELDKINARLRGREMNQALISSFSRSGWSASNSLGLWVRDPWSQSFCFLPFGFGWSSPYGFGYDRSIWSYQLPSNITYTLGTIPNAANGQQPANPPFQTISPGTGNFPSPPAGNFPANPEPNRGIDPSSNPGVIKNEIYETRRPNKDQ